MRLTPSNKPQSNTHASSSNLQHKSQPANLKTSNSTNTQDLFVICESNSSSTFTAAFQLRVDEYTPSSRLKVVMCGGATQYTLQQDKHTTNKTVNTTKPKVERAKVRERSTNPLVLFFIKQNQPWCYLNETSIIACLCK